MKADVDAAPLDYGTIRAHRLQAEDVCSESGCTDPVVARYGIESFNGAGMEFIVTWRLCAQHHATYHPALEGRIVIVRT